MAKEQLEHFLPLPRQVVCQTRRRNKSKIKGVRVKLN